MVDDDDQLRRALRINLAARRYEVRTAADAAERPGTIAARTPPDLAIVDLGLPDLDGVDVVRGLRGWTTIPIIVLSARDAQAAEGGGARRGRRRLRDQAVRDGRAARPDPGRAAPGRARNPAPRW